MRKSKWLVLTLSVIFIFNDCLYAQHSRDALEREKQINLRKIREAEKILAETRSEKKATIGELTALNQQIKSRTQLIESFSKEIKFLDEEISDLSIVVRALERDLVQLKDEYADMIYAAYKSQSGFNRLTFLFSASSFNQLFMRLKYLEQYTKARKVQVDQIEKVRDELNIQRTTVSNKRKEQSDLLDEQIVEQRKLIKLKKNQSKLIAELSSKESELKKEVQARKQSIDKLDRLIAEIIEAESNVDDNSNTANMANLNSSFKQKKSALKWPVGSGFISSRFGRQPHPVMKRIVIDNPGIDIQTNRNELVKAVFNGTVATIAFVPGMNNVVIVKHGNYYTLYAKLRKVNVKKGQVIKENDIIGEVFTDSKGKSEVHFEVWEKNKKLNPENWLASR